MIEYTDRETATKFTRIVVKASGVKVVKIRTTQQSNGSLFSVITLESEPGKLVVDRAMQALKRAGYEDVAVSAIGKYPTVFARSWVRGKRKK